MALPSASDFSRMLRLGVDIIRSDPTISQANFRTALEPIGYSAQDWMLSETLLALLEYVPTDPTFPQIRNFWSSSSPSQERNIRSQLTYEFEINPLGLIARLEAQRSGAIEQRNAIRDLLDILVSWSGSPPVDTPQEVLDALEDGIRRKRSERDGIIFVIETLSNTILGLSR